jgi:Nif-specific regulatory protein
MTGKLEVAGLQDRLENRRSKEIQKLSTLLHISQAVAGTLQLKAALQEVLDTLGRHHDAVRSVIVLLNKETHELSVEASHGAGRPAHGPYTFGEGIVGRVIETGKHIIVPRVSLEPSLASHSRHDTASEEQSFICMPIAVDRQPVGALGITVKFRSDRNFERSAKFFGVVASMIGQALKVQRLVAAQHRRLVTENARLKQELREGYDFSNIVGSSGPMQRVYEAVAQVARTNTTVLVRGESGTGKELIAQAIHYNSLRAK